MVTVVEFIVTLLASIAQLIATFVFDVLLSSPLSAILLIVGAVFVGGASLVMLYLSLGALAEWLGGAIASPAGGQH
ncbi:MAG: hypothetical protein ABEJ74_05635 [Haloferacaceae archaeon]